MSVEVSTEENWLWELVVNLVEECVAGRSLGMVNVANGEVLVVARQDLHGTAFEGRSDRD